MNSVLSLDVASMAGLSFVCGCGNKHEVEIKKIFIGKNAADEVAKTSNCKNKIGKTNGKIIIEFVNLLCYT